jgi:hypothetical protein
MGQVSVRSRKEANTFLRKLGDTIIFPTNMDSKTAPLTSVSNKMFGA